jgi:hypothetical protein
LPSTPFLNIIKNTLSFNVRDLTANTQVRSQVSSYGICGGRSATGIFFLRLLRFYPVTVIRRVRRIHPSPIAYNLSNLQLRKMKVSLSVAKLTQGERDDCEFDCRIG